MREYHEGLSLTQSGSANNLGRMVTLIVADYLGFITK
jgi:hypothetical protein